MKENMPVLDISKQKKNDKSDGTSFFAHYAQDKSQTELELSPLDHKPSKATIFWANHTF